MWELDHKEGWVPKNWCFWIVVLEVTLENPLDTRIKLVNPKEINLEDSLEGLMLKLKLQYVGHLMQRDDSLKKILMLRKIKSRRRREWQKMSWLDSNTKLMDMNIWKFWEIVKDRETYHAAVHGVQRVGHNLVTEKQKQKRFLNIWIGHWKSHLSVPSCVHN